MQANDLDLLIHLLDELRYAANCALAVAHGCVAYKDVGEVREQGAVSFATPSNRKNYSASQRLARHHSKRTLRLVQLQFLGSY